MATSFFARETGANCMEERVYTSTHVENLKVYRLYIRAQNVTELSKKLGITIHAARTQWHEAKGPAHRRGRNMSTTKKVTLIHEQDYADTRTVQPAELRRLS